MTINNSDHLMHIKIGKFQIDHQMNNIKRDVSPLMIISVIRDYIKEHQCNNTGKI